MIAIAAATHGEEFRIESKTFVGKEKAALALWLKEVAPSPELRTWFGHDPAR